MVKTPFTIPITNNHQTASQITEPSAGRLQHSGLSSDTQLGFHPSCVPSSRVARAGQHSSALVGGVEVVTTVRAEPASVGGSEQDEAQLLSAEEGELQEPRQLLLTLEKPRWPLEKLRSIPLSYSLTSTTHFIGSWLEVRSVSTRIVFITIFMATLVVYAHYTSALVSLLTVASTSVGFSSLQELVQDGSYRFGFRSGTLLEQEFRKAHHSVFRDVWEELVLPHADSLVTENQHGIAKVTEEKYVYMMEENMYRSNYGNNCRVMQVKGSYFTTQTGLALRRHSPLTKILDAQLIKFRDGGLLSRAWRRWQPVVTHCSAQRVVAIELNHLFTAFLLLLLGMILSVVILPCERLHWQAVGKLKAHQIQVMRQKGLVSPLPPPQDLPAARGDISLMGRLRYSTHHSPPLAPFGTQ
ncbi:glutamate receptor ionotropic, kainate 5-like [Portunus trituberculatus]|uniref:glutamate receptor ionotropic, kainate 5-like n=1 Tax=Portunus trituberculatus TaxID=210409 RepID=UPI001E1CD5DE|nr:glutamate receptor ionotropic, kainate 5-like [Portunus trituberculatus]